MHTQHVCACELLRCSHPCGIAPLVSPRVWDLLQHWEVEQGGDAPSRAINAMRLGLHDENCAASLEVCPLDLLAVYGRIWALQQMLQSGTVAHEPNLELSPATILWAPRSNPASG